MVAVPVRASALPLAATDSRTVPLPVPEPPDATVIQGSPLLAVQAQAPVAWTVTSSAPPPPPMSPEPLPSENWQLAAACSISTRWSLITTPPRRSAGWAFAVTV